jgi:hypothetical protein
MQTETINENTRIIGLGSMEITAVLYQLHEQESVRWPPYIT